MKSPQVNKLDEAVASCMKCGLCKAACPVFLDEETTSPRAKVRLARAVQRGELELTAGIKREAARCLNCRACAAECPSGVEPNKIALMLRTGFVERDGLPLLKRFAFSGPLAHPRLGAWGSRIMGIGQHILALDLQNNPLRLLLPSVGVRADRDLPSFGRKTLMARLPEELEASNTQKTRVLYFPGCAANLLYPEIGLATVSVLRKLGARVILPRELVCCSTPVFTSGDVDSARRLATRNMQVFESVQPDYIVTSCGSCGLTIKHEWSEVLGLDTERLSAKVLDVSEFVARYVPDGAVRNVDDAAIATYHDSCHLRRGMGVVGEPRQLLSEVMGSQFVEMESPDRCCGGGGAFSLEHPVLSQTIADTKMKCIADTNADKVITGCPACIMQLRDSAVHRGMNLRVEHTIQTIDRALHGDE